MVLVLLFFCRCPILSNQCTYGLANIISGSFAPATELDLKRFQPSPFRELVWHFSTQMNSSDLAAYISVFDSRSDKCRRFIPFLVYSLVYLGIASNLVTLANLSS